LYAKSKIGGGGGGLLKENLGKKRIRSVRRRGGKIKRF